MGRKNKNKKMWNRKRKLELNDKRKNEDRKPYKMVVSCNPKMEAYYAYLGLHAKRQGQGENSDKFVPCNTPEEMEEERSKFIDALRAPLPASFRIGQNLEPDLRSRLKKDVEEFVGTEIEIEIDEDGNAVSKPKEKKDDSDGADGDVTETDGDAKMKDSDDANANGLASEDATEASEVEAAASNGKTTIKKLAPAKPIPFIPDGYQLSVDRRTIRKNPSLQQFHEWLKVQSDAGFITRQETVSMIPPVVLSPEPDHAVLDTCAAPGSKTSQLLEIISKIKPGDMEPKGFVVANDSDAKRAYMLVHQLRRLNSPAVFVTAKDAQFWPMLLRGNNTTDEERAQEGMFDRVLCDVPCSGDGTARKNPGIWKHWTASGGHSLHPLQVSIALNGARLAKVGGYVCYSTCSMNPIENEAVVAEILRLTDGSLELVDKRPDLKGMVAREGWSTWKVMGELRTKKQMKDKAKKNNAKMKQRRKEWEMKQKKESEAKDKEEEAMETESKTDNTDAEKSPATQGDGKVDADAEETVPEPKPWVQAPPSWDDEALRERALSRGLTEYKSYEDVPDSNRGYIRESCFPPTPEEVEKFKLDRCLRCLPHDLDTGGFFVALFKKVSPLSARARRKAEAIASDIESKKNPEASENDPNDEEKEVTVEEPEAKKAKLDNGDGDSNDNAAPTNGDSQSEDKSAGETKRTKTKFGFDKSDSFVAVEDDILPPLIDFYGLSDSFAKGQFMTRASGKSKLLYFITESVKKNLIDRGAQDRLQVINSGLRAFERRNKDDCEVIYRPCQESVHFVGPHMTKRKFIVSYDDFLVALKDGAIKFNAFSEPLASQIKELTFGAFVIALKGYENNVGKKMYLVMWRCKGDNVNCLVSRPEMAGFESKLKALALPTTSERGIALEKTEEDKDQQKGRFSSICTVQ